MAYKTRQPSTDVKSRWEQLPVAFVSDKTAAELRSMGGSQRYGDKGGCWVNENIYQSIGGYRSRGGMPT
jgi:hypothetical protein